MGCDMVFVPVSFGTGGYCDTPQLPQDLYAQLCLRCVAIPCADCTYRRGCIQHNEEEIEGTTLFKLEEDVEEAALFCAYDAEASDDLFDDYWEALKNSEMQQYFDNVVTDEMRTINGYKYHYRLSKYSNRAFEKHQISVKNH